MKRRRILINAIVVTVVAALSVYYLTKSGVVTAEALKRLNFADFTFTFAFYAGTVLLLSLVDFFVYRSFTRSMGYGKCLLNTMSGHLGSSVTPFKSGHFPLMAYYQNSAGVPLSDTVTGLVKCQIIYSATSIALYTIVVSVLAAKGYTTTFNGVTVKLWMIVSLGLIFHAAVFAAIIVLAFNPPLQRKAVGLWAKFLRKIKKIDDAEAYLAEKAIKLKLFKEQISIIGRRFYKYLLPCFLYALYLVLQGSLQYAAYLLITDAAFSFSDMFLFYTLNLASAYITNVIPVPGGVGTSEVLFTLVFAAVIPDAAMGAVVVLWRLATFYVAVMAELIAFSVSIFVRRSRLPKDKTPAGEDEDGADGGV